jgi:ABC-type transport system involved in multi-copper enzyme maturation permease subunit
MTFLPMVQRELRVLARKPATYRWRWIVGGVAFGIALLLIMIMGLAGSPKGWGEALFVTLTVYAATVSLLVGLFGAADILSEERREGTLGLLFLTDLKGYDVVLGKFSAVALNALYWLLAIIPVLSLPLLIGGVTFGEFVRVSLSLMNLLFFALAVGTWASARSVQLLHSLVVTAGMLAIFNALTPLLFSVLNLSGGVTGYAWLTCSPMLALLSAGSETYDAAPRQFWYPLLTSQLLGWGFLMLSAWQLPKVWQQPVKETGGWVAANAAKDQPRMTFAERSVWLDGNPVTFLMRPGKAIRRGGIALAVFAALILLADTYLNEASFWRFPFMSSAVEWGMLLPLKILLTVHACRFFSEARQSGVFELLLSTPLNVREIVSAHWKVIHRVFAWPYVALMLFILAASLSSYVSSGSANAISGALGLVFASVKLTAHAFDYFLLGWMGAWMGLKLSRPSWAPFFTILFALILPAFMCGLGILIKPILLAVARHNVVYELPRLVRMKFDAQPVHEPKRNPEKPPSLPKANPS